LLLVLIVDFESDERYSIRLVMGIGQNLGVLLKMIGESYGVKEGVL